MIELYQIGRDQGELRTLSQAHSKQLKDLDGRVSGLEMRQKIMIRVIILIVVTMASLTGHLNRETAENLTVMFLQRYITGGLM